MSPQRPSSAARSPRRAPDPVEPQLRLVRRQRRERTRLVGSGALVVIFVLLFVLAACQAVLVQGQLELDQIAQDMDGREEARQKLLLEVATLESPARIEATARELGMVDPPDVVFLEISPPATGSASDSGAAVTGADLAAASTAAAGSAAANPPLGPPGATP